MINWLLSKTSTLIYAFIILSALFYYFGFQSGFYELDTLSEQSNNLAKLLESVDSSRYNLETNTTLEKVDKLEVKEFKGKHYLLLYRGKRNISKEIPETNETNITNPRKIGIIKKDEIRLEKWN